MYTIFNSGQRKIGFYYTENIYARFGNMPLFYNSAIIRLLSITTIISIYEVNASAWYMVGLKVLHYMTFIPADYFLQDRPGLHNDLKISYILRILYCDNDSTYLFFVLIFLRLLHLRNVQIAAHINLYRIQNST